MVKSGVRCPRWLFFGGGVREGTRHTFYFDTQCMHEMYSVDCTCSKHFADLIRINEPSRGLINTDLRLPGAPGVFYVYSFLAFMRRHYVIHKTGSTWYIATPLVEDRAMATGKIRRKFDKLGTCGYWDRGRQTDTVIAVLRSLTVGGVINANWVVILQIRWIKYFSQIS